MEEILLKVFSETWIIAGLFVATFLAFLWRGIPVIFQKFETITQQHKEEIRENQKNFQESFDRQRITFENTMKEIVVTFNAQIQKSNDWHEKHSDNLIGIKNEIRNLKKRKWEILE